MTAKKSMTDSKAREELAAAMQASSDTIVIAQPKVVSIVLEVEGTAPLIQNAFSQKAIEEMLRKHMGLSVQREKKKPREVIENAIVRNIKNEVCMPVTAFKAAMITATGGLKTFEKKGKLLKTSLFIEGNAIPIEFERMVPRMDMVRTSGINRTPDVRFRPQFDNWKARFAIQFTENLWQVQSIVDLVQRAGRVGIGEWRPEKGGTYGTFRVVRNLSDPKEIAEVQERCSVLLKTPTIPEWALDMNIDPTLLSKVFTSGDGDGDDAPQEDEEVQPSNGVHVEAE